MCIRDSINSKEPFHAYYMTFSGHYQYNWDNAMSAKNKAAVEDLDVYKRQEQREDRPNAVFERDNFFMTPEGAIVMRLAMPQRRGEERYTAQTLARCV